MVFQPVLLALGLMLAASGAPAQTPPPAPATALPQLSSPLPAGQGAGVHGANSPFPPIKDRPDVVPWSVLTDVRTRTQGNKILPVFGPAQLGLDRKKQRVQGYMMPLEPGERQRHFLLTSVPLTCGFCVPGGPESMIEVRTRVPVAYSMEPVVVEGRFQVLPDDPYGLYYRVTDAIGVK